MTDFTLPPFVVNYDARWIDVDLRGDLGDWARRVTKDIYSRVPGHHGAREKKRFASLLESAGEVARRPQDASIALLLFPSMRDGIKASVRFCPVDLAGQDAEDAWTWVLDTLPDDEPPEITEISTGAGPCRRIRQRYVTGEGPERPLGERLGYVWILPRWDAVVIMTTAFTDLLEAGRWLSALDDLAAACGLEPAAEEAPSQ
jgi:hypothetical protein